MKYFVLAICICAVVAVCTADDSGWRRRGSGESRSSREHRPSGESSESRESRESHEICGHNEHYTNCGTACPLTCAKPNVQICTMQCVSGCVCDDGYVRDEKTGKCVELKDCSE